MTSNNRNQAKQSAVARGSLSPSSGIHVTSPKLKLCSDSLSDDTQGESILTLGISVAFVSEG